MTEATGAGARIAALDVTRGIAVMGILAMNIVAFAMPAAAYTNPIAYGIEGPADLASWAFSFVFIDGRMRGLFSFLFGASMLLVIERAEAAEPGSGAGVHYSRMAWLLVFGLIHFYLVWWGDILSLYAPVGMVAYFFWQRSPRALIWTAIACLVVQFVGFALLAGEFAELAAAVAGGHPTAEQLQAYRDMSGSVAPYPPGELAEALARYRGPWLGIVRHTLENWAEPITGFFLFGLETLGYMLLGMAALKTGFLAGAWPRADYAKVMLVGFGISLPVYAALAWLIFSRGFDPVDLFWFSIALTVPIRPLAIGATAALILVASERGRARIAAGEPSFVARIAAAGRAAFTNYLGASLLMTGLFYGWGLGWFGSLSRIELWVPVILVWALMLAWSKPWLDLYLYGPFEWLWRSLARRRLQPMRKAA